MHEGKVQHSDPPERWLCRFRVPMVVVYKSEWNSSNSNNNSPAFCCDAIKVGWQQCVCRAVCSTQCVIVGWFGVLPVSGWLLAAVFVTAAGVGD